MANEQTLDLMRDAAAQVEINEWTQFGLITAYPGLPPLHTALTPPYSYRLYVSTDMGDPDYSDGGSAGTGRASQGMSEDPRVHTLWNYLMIGDRIERVGIPKLDELSTPWIDRVPDAYRANLTLLHTCSRVKIVRIKIVQDELLGTKHFGLKYITEIVARPIVLTRA